MQLPDPLKPGDLVKVVTPSGALREIEAFSQGVDIWRSRGYQVEFTSHWDSHFGYLGGEDNQRRQALSEAWLDPNCKAILCTRGGYGSARLLEKWTWELSTSPKWVIGFSDITGLLWSLATVGISGVHGPVLTTLASEPEWSIERLFDWVEGRPLSPLSGEGWGGGQVIGDLLPANLTVATHLLGTSLQPELKGVILALEDVTEAPYRIDRMLTQWRLMGLLEKVGGIALGRFSRCQAPVGSSSWTVEEVLRDRLGDLNIPIVGDLPFGHDGVNAVLPVGHRVRLDGDEGKLEFLSQ
ncbi:peptidase U61 LD-carboxypeptidase A [Gloeothece citriformis PCC 7424]|uniref:Peptidase U61 LD-carboxypeptidase A n=1 Tax=Gloeothece citriformis (strain PCC 7424) TaxID=65393 RepID=B7KKW1_GLOC7|nr:LD-carboxypeptidase [Gloeothece citriformis]ACK71080.1 peptidase U61 LD-carboxypeptidase A [Gloeothece citriformis PCC 7424]